MGRKLEKEMVERKEKWEGKMVKGLKLEWKEEGDENPWTRAQVGVQLPVFEAEVRTFHTRIEAEAGHLPLALLGRFTEELKHRLGHFIWGFTQNQRTFGIASALLKKVVDLTIFCIDVTEVALIKNTDFACETNQLTGKVVPFSRTEAEIIQTLERVDEDDFAFLKGLRGGGRKSKNSRKGKGGPKPKASQAVSGSNKSANKSNASKTARGRVENEDIEESQSGDEPSPKRARVNEARGAVIPDIEVTIQMLLGNYYERFKNLDIIESVEVSVLLDRLMLSHVSDSSWMIEVVVISARLMQLFNDHCEMREGSGEDLSVSMISPLYFHNGVNKERMRGFFLTDYRRSNSVVLPIFYSQHFTVAIQEVKRGRNESDFVECKYYDSFHTDAPGAVKEKLKFVANSLHPTLRYVYVNASAECDEQFDFVNCGAFMVENVQSYFIHGEVQQSILSGYQKRLNLLKAVAPLIEYEFDENVVMSNFDAFFARQMEELDETTLLAAQLNAQEYGIHYQNDDFRFLFDEDQTRVDEEVEESNNDEMEIDEDSSSEEEVPAPVGMTLRSGKVIGEGSAFSKKSKAAQRKQMSRENMDENTRKSKARTSQQKQREKTAEKGGADDTRKKNRGYQQKSRQTKKQKDLGIPADILDEPVESIELHYLGEMNVICTKCGAKHYKQETKQKDGSFSSCCSNGKVILAVSNGKPFPALLKSLFKREHPKSNFFFSNIRQINKMFAFGSPITKEIKNNGGGPFMYRQQGEFRRAFNCAELPADRRAASYGQLYMIETDEAHGIRAEINLNLKKEDTLLRAIGNIMHKENAYAQGYAMLKDEMDKAQAESLANGTTPPAFKLLFSLKKGADQRRENMPRTNEVAAVYIEGPNAEAPPAYIVANDKDGKLKILSPLDEAVEPMLYPLLYPTGNKGWSCASIFNTAGKKVTLLQYVKHMLSIRDEDKYGFNVLLYGGKLKQEWIVDQCLRISHERLEFNRVFVNEKISAAYDSIDEYLRAKAAEIGAEVGRKVILPSTYIGSRRYMSEAYDDAMGMVRAFGKPDLFITMTCNPKWQEILDELRPGQTASDWPDLVARIFRLKYKALIEYIIESKIFGDVIAQVGTIEFQKRGLPHVHLLFTLSKKTKLVNPELIDQCIRAEIPDRELEPRLYEVITSNNVHQCVKKNKKGEIIRYMPCCTAETYNPDGQCQKRFPKEFQDATEVQTGGYAKYRRRDNGRTVTLPDGQIVDNRRVVPFCPQLSLAFNCHINVEHVADIDVVKYLHKYIFKGADVALIEKEFYDQTGTKKILHYDEIAAHIKCRYLSAPEAAWRSLGYEIVIKSHHVEKLELHLPGKQRVFLREDVTDEELRAAKDNKKSKLMAYFDFNKEAKKKYPEGHKLTKLRYLDVPKECTWHPKDQEWKIRKGYYKTIGRLYSVSPKQHELFHLRMLLLNVEGPESFDDLKTVEEVLHPTFKAACLALGLITDDAEYRNAMTEAAGYKMPYSLRVMLAMLLIHCGPSDPQLLYDEFKRELSEDYIRKHGEDLGIKVAYRKIEEILLRNDSSFEAFNMESSVEIDETTLPNFETGEPGVLSDEELANQFRSQMNEEQAAILSDILNDVADSEVRAKCKFIDGPGGSGKSFLFTGAYHTLRSMNKRVLCMAFTGIAADLMPNGRTIHSYFKLGLDLTPTSTSGIERGTIAETVLKHADVFILDEASMISKIILEIIDRTLREIMKNNVPFGGKVVILGGDFRQTLPIIERATPAQILQNIIKASELWKQFKVFKLTKNMRANPDEVEFAREILEIGEGKKNDREDNIVVPDQYLFNGDLVREIFGEIITDDNIESLKNCAILAPTNKEVDEINAKALLLVEGESKIYYANDEIREADNKKHRYVVELLNSINPSGIPKHAIELKKNAPIMLLRNLDIEEGLVNGTRLRVLEMRQYILVCKVLTGTRAGKVVFIPRITLECKKNLPVPFLRKQLPVRPAFSITINKSQGQTLEKVGIKLDVDECFGHGQLYVAMSRGKARDKVKIQLNKKAKKVTKNVVYKEAL